MKVAVIGDIHSNAFALKSVLEELGSEGISSLIVLGDIFGYYPWSSETYHLLKDWNLLAAIKGNHDLIVLEQDDEVQSKHLAYYPQARYNRHDLLTNCPEALTWLSGLQLQETFVLDERIIRICHGTPENEAQGRFYPDDKNLYAWFPKPGQVLMLGHTHYPLYRINADGGVILNPGSVGQPRDGNTSSAWGVFYSDSLNFEFRRTEYDHKQACSILRDMNWDSRSIAALEKNYSGKLKL